MRWATVEEKKIATRLLRDAYSKGDCLTTWRSPIPRGYVNVKADGKWWRAHRLIYHCFVSPVEPGEFILHTCDNRKCLNHAHLYRGTAKQNTQDMMLRKRGWNGQKSYGWNFVQGE